MILEEIVQKLGLAIEKYPKPYKLAFLKKKNEITMGRCRLVNFSIGSNYKVKV